MGKRHIGRSYALQILFGLDLKEEFDILNEDNWETFINDLSFKPTDFTKELIFGILKNLNLINDVISSTSTHWKVERMSLVDRNILRIGIFELLSGSEPPIVINEALILAGTFGSEKSTSFINGILDNAKSKIETYMEKLK